MRTNVGNHNLFINRPLLAIAACGLLTSVATLPAFAESRSTHRHKRQPQQVLQQKPNVITDTNKDDAEAIAAAKKATFIDVVVSATGFEQNVKDAPASISIITREQIEKGTFNDLTDALRSVQGVAVTGTASAQDIYIRGLTGQYTLILIDGKRMNTREARTNGNSGFEQSFIPPANAIERIEVIRGPMSSLYGSDAMGGVINIITRKVADKWTGSITVDGTANEHSKYGDSYSGNFYLAGPIVQDVVGLQVWGHGLKRQQDKMNNGSFQKKDRDINGRLVITPNEDHDFKIEGGSSKLNRYTDVDSISKNTNSRDHYSISHTGRWGWTTSEFSILYEEAQRKNWTETTAGHAISASERSPRIKNTVYDGKFTTPFELWGNHTLVTGGQYIQSKLRDQNPGRRDGMNYNFGIDQWALFAEDEWWMTDTFALTGGLRMDHHELYDAHWSPRLYGVWHATDNFTIKGGVSTGFRAPDIRSIVPGYAYTTGGGNCYYGDQSKRPPNKSPCAVMIGGKGLEAEKSTSYEFAVLYDNLSNIKLGATYFYTDFKDKITNERAYDANGNYVLWNENPYYTVFYNLNIDKAVMQGVELTSSWQINENIGLQANYTYTHSEQKTGTYKGLPLARTPEHMANVRVDWNTSVDGLNLWAAANYHGKEKNAGLRIGSVGKPIYKNGKILAREYDDYATVDIGAGYKFNNHVSLNTAVYNIFDKKVNVDEFNNVVEGRRYWLSMTSSF